MNSNKTVNTLMFFSFFVFITNIYATKPQTSQGTLQQRKSDVKSNAQHNSVSRSGDGNERTLQSSTSNEFMNISRIGASPGSLGTTTYEMKNTNGTIENTVTITKTGTTSPSQMTITSTKNPNAILAISTGSISIVDTDKGINTVATKNPTTEDWTLTGSKFNGTISPNSESGYTFEGTNENNQQVTIVTALNGSDITVTATLNGQPVDLSGDQADFQNKINALKTEYEVLPSLPPPPALAVAGAALVIGSSLLD